MSDRLAPPGKEVEYEVWPRDEPSKKVIVRARTWYFAVQLGAIHWQKHPHELDARVKEAKSDG
jgi:hypothetical protein